MTAEVEVLQIEGVVVDLVDRASVELLCADFEFDHVDRVAGDENRVGALAHPGDEELQEQMADVPSREDVLQDLDLGYPSIALEVLKGMGMRLGEKAENLVRRRRQKL